VRASSGDSPAATQFLDSAEESEAVRRLFDDDGEQMGFVMNASRLWAYQPEAIRRLFELMDAVTSGRPFTLRERGILVTACASALGDSCCSLVWGTRLAEVAGPRLAAGILRGKDDELTEAERAMAAWARRVARDPNGTTAGDVEQLRNAGFADADIFAMTAYVALRLAFSTVNDALGVLPDVQLRAKAPAEVREAVAFGRPIAPGRL
jgi:uncharacterized peroxidase-related enzyme